MIWERNNYHFQNTQGRNNGRLKVTDGQLLNDMKECDIFTTNEGLQHATEHDLMHLSLLQVKPLQAYSKHSLANTKIQTSNNIFGEIFQLPT